MNVSLLIYNNIPFDCHAIKNDNKESFGVVSVDRKNLDQSDLILFHVPLLEWQTDNDIGKPNGQLWVLWCRKDEGPASRVEKK